MNARIVRGAVLGLSLAVLVAGCGPGKGTVSGKVTHKGKAVVWGSVTLHASNGVQFAEPIKEDGTYSIANVPGGRCKLGVSSPNPDTSGRGKMRPGGDLGGEGATNPVPKGVWFSIPEKYADAEKSGLTGTVSGDTKIDLDLP